MSTSPPTVVLLGGPNGAGKSTIAPGVIERVFQSVEFVNADTIARGLSGLAPDRQAFAAGRVMLSHIHRLAERRCDFAFETTLASRTFAPFLQRMIADGYSFHLIYISLRSPKIAVERVRARVAAGGHHVPEETIRRRFARSIFNFFDLYVPLASQWQVFDNSSTSAALHAIASGGLEADTIVHDPVGWERLENMR